MVVLVHWTLSSFIPALKIVDKEKDPKCMKPHLVNLKDHKIVHKAYIYISFSNPFPKIYFDSLVIGDNVLPIFVSSFCFSTSCKVAYPILQFH